MPRSRTRRSLAAVVLAAGKGKRLKSSLPKVLHPLCGRSLLWHTVQNALATRPERLVFVVSNGSDRVRQEVGSWGLRVPIVFVDQGEPLGTGHAVLAAEQAVGRSEEVLVIGGDYDPVTPADVRALLRAHRRSGSAASLLTADVDEPRGYARIVREGSRLVDIVEGSDAPAELRKVKEVSALVFAFRRKDLFAALPLVGRENRQREHYLNEVFPILLDKGERVSAVKVDTGGLMGSNSRADLAALGALVRSRINAAHLANGVTIVDPAVTYIDVGVRIGADTVIRPLTFLEGHTRIGAGCSIGPSTRIVDSRVADGATVEASVVKGARIGREATVGPYTHIRPGTVLGPRAKAGSFVEIKGSTVGEGSKVPHLSYVGDATVGKGVNVGAATVTANYDGYAKHRTVIDDDARIGSDTMLIAPVRVGRGAVTGAGSVITKDVPPGALAVERSEQRIVKGYRKRKDAEAKRTASAKGKRTR
ncbi:MAG TPA: bifunctional UDP-N-acetylglucosamine diphosphorylase/glucosamine-1-phosphate N-acetyltransferase GlmU [Actinomycetota bacterium]|nr:bifunctional UDP-N-acetylglucosamine diphosphorylase/glucosamine-1-phosphate N-acetyltransferase GlmU [Actinomycetota bacterium]